MRLGRNYGRLTKKKIQENPGRNEITNQIGNSIRSMCANYLDLVRDSFVREQFQLVNVLREQLQIWLYCILNNYFHPDKS